MRPPKIKEYPRRLRVRGEEWTIKFVRRIGKDPSTLGLCDPSDRIIYIRLKQSAVETFKTYIHEVIHAIEAENDFDLPHTQKNDMVDKLEQGIAEVLLNNF